MSGRWLTISLIFVLAIPIVSANPSSRGSILIPINPGVLRGASGTTWTTSLFVTNTGDYDAEVDCTSIVVDLPCQIIQAHSSAEVRPPYLNVTHQGFFINVSTFLGRPDLQSLSFHERTIDVTTAPQGAGTELSLPTPDDFRSGVIVLPPVPANGHSRALLRIYGLGNGAVVVTLSGSVNRSAILHSTLSLTGWELDHFPSYAELVLPLDMVDPAMRVQIETTAGLRVWGFVSITDNVSQQFTTFSPHYMETTILSAAEQGQR